jgi:hypothetical protein
MTQTLVQLELNDTLVAQLKHRSSTLNISLSALCNQLLEYEVLGGDLNIVAQAILCIKLDDLLSTLRLFDPSLPNLALFRDTD